MSKDIDELKLCNWQNELKDISDQFHTALHNHFNLVKFKAKRLIDTRWNNKEEV